MHSRLIYCESNSSAKIIDIDGRKGANENLRSSGFKIGSIIRIVKNPGHGPIFIDNGMELIEMGQELSAKIIVETDNTIELPLHKIRIGDRLLVTKISSKGEIRRRLLDMGIVKGNELTVIRKAPLGDPIEILINRFNLSLRIEEAETIFGKPTEIDY